MAIGQKLGVALTAILLVCTANAVTPVKHAAKHRRHKKHKPTWFEHRVFVPSRDNLLSQNAAIDELGLERLKDDKALKAAVAADGLVSITSNEYVRISPKLETKRRFCRPWVDDFLQELGKAYFEEFEEPIQVNSAVRTVRTQIRLIHWNHNAAPAHGETASAHLAGVAVDLQRRGLTRRQIGFIQQKLLYLAKLNMVIVEEELTSGGCFHIVVTGEYPYPPIVKMTKQSLPDLFNDNR